MSSVIEPTVMYVDLEDVRRCLWGKSHFFDRDTMRGFGSRMLTAHRCGDVLLTLVRDKHPSDGLVFSVVLFNLEDGQAKRILRHDTSRSRARRIFEALWQDIMAERNKKERQMYHGPQAKEMRP